MSIPNVEITNNGVIVPSLEQTVSGLWDVFKNAFGQELNTSMNTPQGQLVTSLAAMITDERNQWVQFTNQLDPKYAQGMWQDGIANIYFLKRKLATKSTAQLEVHGRANVVIPKGFLFSDTSGRTWQTTSQSIVPSGGMVVISVECTIYGAIDAAPNTITEIILALSGLDRVTNPAAAIVGRDMESRVDFEGRRQSSVASNSKNTDGAVRGAVADLPDVVDVYVVSNHSNAQVSHGKTAYPIPRNSILLSVVGGDEQKIAWELLVKAGGGCGFTGNTHVIVQDTDTYPQNPPSYDVAFLRPSHVTLYWRITVQDKTAISFQEEKSMKDAIIAALKTGNTRARIAQVIRAPLYISSLYAAYSALELISLEISLDYNVWHNVIELGVDQFPVSTNASIEVVQ